MVDTSAGVKTKLAGIADSDRRYHHQAYKYFVLLGIGNVGNKVLPNPLVLSALQNLSSTPQEVQNFL